MLTSLDFSDLYLTADGSGYYKLLREPYTIRPTGDHDAALLQTLRQIVDEHRDALEFSVVSGDVRLRAVRLETVGGPLIVLRKLPLIAGDMNTLGIPRHISATLTAATLRSGLVMFVGQSRAGKTTTLAAWARDRLIQHGGVCCALESPVEMNLQGRHGDGQCFQMECRTDSDFGDGMRRVLRAAPNMILLGEIRDADAAREALHAATSGHLVGATFHAGSITAALTRLTKMVNDNDYVAEALAAVVHLQLVSGNRTRVQVSPLIVTGNPSGEESVRANIRSGQIHMLSSVIEQQRLVASRSMQIIGAA